MEHDTIEWQTEESESKTRLVTKDGHWHLDTETRTDRPNRVTLVNMDVLGSPIGMGESPLECWRKFVENCDRFAEKLAKVRGEAAAILAEMEGNEQEA